MINISHLDNIFLALLVATCTVVSYVAYLSWWRLVPRLFYPEERRLKKQIAELRAEAERCNNTDMLHQRGKLSRQAQQLAMELARVRRSRICFSRNHGSGKLEKDEQQFPFLREVFARLKYAFPSLVGLFISFGFMIPVMYLYGSRPAVVVIPRCFRIDLFFHTALVEPLMMLLLLLCPLPWGSFGMDTMRRSAGEWMHTHTKNCDRVGDTSGDNGSGSTTAAAAAAAVPPAPLKYPADGSDNLGSELHTFGVFSWFLACYVAVRLTHRVFAPR